MKNTYTAMICGLALATSVGCASKKEHEAKFCSALTALNDDVTKLSAIGPSSTIDELGTAVSNLQRDSRTADRHGRRIGTPAAKQFTQSVDQLDRESRVLSGSMTVAQAQARIESDVQNMTRNAQALANESGCPDAMPRGMTGQR
jgi:hypothetical protein